MRYDEIRAVISPNSAGKTVFNCLTGVLPHAGHICSMARTSRAPPADHAKGIAARRSCHRTRRPSKTCRANRGTTPGAFRIIAPIDLIDASRRCCSRSNCAADELAANLSHGEQRNLEIGIALATKPQLLCLDEPTAGMSATETRETMALVRSIAKNLTILIVEHDMQVVMELAQRITVLHYGEVLAEGTPAEIQQNPRVLEVYLKT